MIGKAAFANNEDTSIGRVTKIIDQKDSDEDNECLLGDIKSDLFQIVVKIDSKKFAMLSEPTEILFSSQTIESVSKRGFKLLLTKEAIESYLEKDLH